MISGSLRCETQDGAITSLSHYHGNDAVRGQNFTATDVAGGECGGGLPAAVGVAAGRQCG